MSTYKEQTQLEQDLDSFDSAVRRSALEELAERARSGAIALPPVKDEVNLHYHTFFSFNACGWSPSRIAWKSVKYGLAASGIVDFDVLDGMYEFLDASELLGLRGIVGLETRVFVSELSDKVMSSPNEPGIAYFMASGCVQYPPSGSESERILKSMAAMARNRNTQLVERMNAYLDPVRLDYDADAIPLTPSGNATERHLLLAYDRKAQQVFAGDHAKVAGFWADKLGISESESTALIADTPRFHEKMRSKLMKYGGVGYVKPDSGSFPSLEEAIRMIRGMGALPMATWLDGTNPGEEDSMAFLELLRSKGVVAMNAIPDRNWNIKDPEEKALKVKRLGEIVDAARRLNLPICVGTEMNKLGLPFVDDFSAPELRPFVGDFMDGAYFLYGHTVLARYADLGYFSSESSSAFGSDAARNRFYIEAGKKYPAAEARRMIAENPPSLKQIG